MASRIRAPLLDLPPVVGARERDHLAHLGEAAPHGGPDPNLERLAPGLLRLVAEVRRQDGDSLPVVPRVQEAVEDVTRPVGRPAGAELVEDEEFRFPVGGEDVVLALVDPREKRRLNPVEEVGEVAEDSADALRVDELGEDGDGEVRLPDADRPDDEEAAIDARASRSTKRFAMAFAARCESVSSLKF